MAKTVSISQLEAMFRVQFKVWNGDKAATEVLDDTCHYFANALGLRTKTAERLEFFAKCGSCFYLTEHESELAD